VDQDDVRTDVRRAGSRPSVDRLVSESVRWVRGRAEGQDTGRGAAETMVRGRDAVHAGSRLHDTRRRRSQGRALPHRG